MEIIPMLFVLALAWGIAFMWTYMGITEYFKDNFPASATKDHREVSRLLPLYWDCYGLLHTQCMLAFCYSTQHTAF